VLILPWTIAEEVEAHLADPTRAGRAVRHRRARVER
jgi:hypothetical protein